MPGALGFPDADDAYWEEEDGTSEEPSLAGLWTGACALWRPLVAFEVAP